MEQLVAEAVKAAVGSLVKEAVPAAVAAGRRVWDWLKGKLVGREDAVVAAVEANPAAVSAQRKLEGAVLELLEKEPGLQAELERVLRESGYREAVVQRADVKGDNNVVNQVAGNANVVSNFRIS
jgi:hypothetical protein